MSDTEREKLRKLCQDMIRVHKACDGDPDTIEVARALLSRLDAPTDAEVAEIEKIIDASWEKSKTFETIGEWCVSQREMLGIATRLLNKLRSTQAELSAARDAALEEAAQMMQRAGDRFSAEAIRALKGSDK